MPGPPNVRSFLIADQVFQQSSGKWCVIGVFDRVMSLRFPTLHHSVGLFVVVSDAEGVYDVKVEFRNSKDQVLGAFEGLKLQVTSRLSTVSFGIQTHNLPIPAPGKYFFKLYFNGELAHTDIPLEAVLLEKQA